MATAADVFFALEGNDLGVRKRLNEFRRHDVGRQSFEFNLFDIDLDFSGRIAQIRGVLEDEHGEEEIPLDEFYARLDRAVPRLVRLWESLFRL